MASKSAEDAYRQAFHESTSPLQRLMRVYTVAIESGIDRDRKTMLRAISLLRQTLDYNIDPGIALSLERLYNQCDHHVASDEFSQAVEILERLRSLWITHSTQYPPKEPTPSQGPPPSQPPLP